MKLLKTMFYPVDVEAKTIYIDPMKRERDIVNKWGRGDQPCIGLRGDHLMSHQCYQTYSVVPTETKETILVEWKEEAARSKHLWEGAAKAIVEIISGYAPEEALAIMKRMLRSSRPMAVSAFYERAVNDLKTVISQQAQAS